MLKQRSISAIGIVLVAAIPAFIGGPIFALLVFVLTVAALHELLAAFTQAGARPHRLCCYLGGLALVAARAFDLSMLWTTGLITFTVLALLAAGIVRPEPQASLSDWALSLAGLLYVALPLSLFIALRGLDGPATQHWVNRLSDTLGSGDSARGLAWFGLALSVTWLTDTAAYLVGRSFGKTKLIPAVSPGKTRVGAGAGVVAGALSGVAAALIFGVPISWPVAAGVGFLLSVAGQLGDLGESLIKRSLGIKDMGTLIPGHGGILDRIDALLFAIPAAYFLARLVQEVRWL